MIHAIAGWTFVKRFGCVQWSKALRGLGENPPVKAGFGLRAAVIPLVGAGAMSLTAARCRLPCSYFPYPVRSPVVR